MGGFALAFSPGLVGVGPFCWLRVAGCEPGAFDVHLQDVDLMREAVEERAGEPFRAEDEVHSSNGRLLVTSVAPRS